MSLFADRIDGIQTSVAVKAACRVATTAPIVLWGVQIIDGVAVEEGDRVLVKDQSDPRENGIYNVSVSMWQRAKDFNGNRDVVRGTRVFVYGGDSEFNEYEVTTDGRVVFGVTPVQFQVIPSNLAAAEAARQAEEARDEAVASAGAASADRMAAQLARDAALGFRDEAEGFAEDAEQSALAAEANGIVYPDTATGLAATAPGETFYTDPQDPNIEAVILYRHVVDSAVEISRRPSAAAVQAALAADALTNQRIDRNEPLMMFWRRAADFDDDLAFSRLFRANGLVYVLDGTKDDGSSYGTSEGSFFGVYFFRRAANWDDDWELSTIGVNGVIIQGKRDGGPWEFPDGGVNGGGGTAASGLTEDVDPALVKPGEPTKIIAYDGDGPREIDLSPAECVQIWPAGRKYSAVLTRQVSSTGTVQTSRYAFSRDFALRVPDDPRVVYGKVGLGQSLQAGSNGVTITTPDPIYPNEVLMPDTGDSSDVRLSLTVSSGVAPVLDPATIVGLRPMFSRLGIVSVGYGQTPLETSCYALQRRIRNEMGIRVQVLGFNVAVGGFAYSQLKKGTQPYTNYLLAVQKLRDLLSAQGYRFKMLSFPCTHGESDMTNTSYAADLLEWWTDLNADTKAITGQAEDIPLIVSQASSFGNATLGIGSRQMLQAAMNNPGKILLIGPKYHLPYADNVHLTGPGYHILGDHIAKAEMEILFGAGIYAPLQPVEITRSGALIDVRLSGVVGGLTIDTTTVTERAGTFYGLQVKEPGAGHGGPELTITDVTIEDTDVFRIHLASDPGGPVEVFAGMLGHVEDPRIESERPRTNIRDSDTTPSSYDGRPLYNWLPHFRLTTGS